MYILGISCFYHDSAACLLKDGVTIAACQEERFSRVKHDWRFPVESVRYCLREAGIPIEAVDTVCFYEKPFLKFERILETFLSVAPRGLRAFVDVVPSWIRQKLRVRQVIGDAVGYTGRLLYAEHHLAHAASAFFTSPFEEAAVLTIDGAGEWATASYGTGRANTVSLTHEMQFPDSLGLLYSAVTAFLGFTVNNDEYKVMGMAPYGTPEFAERMTSRLLTINPDGSIRLDLDHFAFQYGRRMFDRRRFSQLFGVPARVPGGELQPVHFNIAASLQKVTETVVLKMAEHVHRTTGSRNLCMAGGVALNSVANGRLLREGPFENIFIQPAAGDAGGAVGAAYVAYHHAAGRQDRHPLKDLYLGPSYTGEEVRKAIGDLRYRELPENELYGAIARLLAEGKVLGWFQGRMELGPRALGNRSILADPRRADMKDIINSRVKFRESFRPFAPAVTEEDAARYFDVAGTSPYMLMTVPVRTGQLPAVTHADGSARVQTVNASANPRFHRLLKAFEQAAGVPVLVNTSLNIKGEPIARSPADAMRCLAGSDMDALVLENFLLVK